MKGAEANKLPSQLIGVHALNVSTVVLEEIGELVIKENGLLEVSRKVELDRASLRRIVKSPLRGGRCQP